MLGRTRAREAPGRPSSSGGPGQDVLALLVGDRDYVLGERAGDFLQRQAVFAGFDEVVKQPGPWRWSSSLTRGHAVVVSVLTPAEILLAARRLAGARPRLAAVVGIVHPEELWRLCRDELDRSRRPHRRLGHARPLVRRRRRGHAADRGAATGRDDPVAGDRRPARTARTPRPALTRRRRA